MSKKFTGALIMSLTMLMLVDTSGLAIARYPNNEEYEENFQVFSALLTSLSKSANDLGLGELEYLVIGGKKYVIKDLGGNFLIAVFDKKDEVDNWYFDLIENSLKSMINYARDEVGLVKDYEVNLFRNVLKNFYEKYEELKEHYNHFKRIMEDKYKEKGVSALEIANTVTLPEIEIWEEDNNIIIKNVKTGDIERFKEILNQTIMTLKER